MWLRRGSSLGSRSAHSALISHVWDGPTHHLNSRELAALARGKLTGRVASKLVAAELSKHRLLVEAVRRRVAELGPPSDHHILEAAVRILADIETHSPDVLRAFLSLPQIGSWAVSCLRRTANGWEDQGANEAQAPLSVDLGYLAAIAATAALRSGRTVELQVPLRAGSLILPGFGMTDLGPGDPWRIAQLRITDNVVTAFSGNRSVILPIRGDLNATSTDARWQAIPRLRTEANGLRLDVALDALDPFLSSLGEPATAPSADELAIWQQRLSEAWQIVVQYHREIAEAFAVAVSTLVPLADTSITGPRSATSGLTFGAIGLSFPRTSASLAELLVHELQHVILGSVEDIYPLVADESNAPLGYTPWRDDPRPLPGMLHGCYAYLGLTAFWRQQRHFGGRNDRMRSEVEFARWRLATLDAAGRVASSPDLTPAGRLVVTGISKRLIRWRTDPVAPEAERLASEALTEHRTRWRINHMYSPDSAVTAFANAWLSGTPVIQYRADMDSVLATRSPTVGPILGYFMEMRYRDPSRFELLMRRGNAKDTLSKFIQRLTEADIALLHLDNTTALREYSRRLRVHSEFDAWIGLAIALQHLSPSASAWVLTERPELVAAVYSRIRAICGESPDPIDLIEWLDECLVPLRALSSTILRSP